MSIVLETQALRRELAALAARPEWELLARCDLLSRKPPRSLPDRLYRAARGLGSAAGLLPPHVTQYLWLPSLKHVPLAEDARTLLIWSSGVGRDELRDACESFSRRLKGCVSLAPVLVTDVADFAYFSRLGWLVEYLPELNGEGTSYRERKRRYLAWRYREAVVVPVSAGFASATEWAELMETRT